MIKRYLNGNLKFNYRFLFYYSDLIIELILVRIFNILYFLLKDKILKINIVFNILTIKYFNYKKKRIYFS